MTSSELRCVATFSKRLGFRFQLFLPIVGSFGLDRNLYLDDFNHTELGSYDYNTKYGTTAPEPM